MNSPCLDALLAISFRENGLEDIAEFVKANEHLLKVSMTQSPHSAV